MRATLSRNGRKTTTRVARIRRSTTRHRRPLPPNSPQQAITLRSVMAPRAGLLLTPPERAYSCRDSNPRWGILQWQVTCELFRWRHPDQYCWIRYEDLVRDPRAAMTSLMQRVLCLLYTSDAADDLLCVDLGGRR